VTELTDQDDRLDLEHRLDRVLTKYLDEKLHRWSHLDAGADRGDLASDLATAARQHYTGVAVDTFPLLGAMSRLQDALDGARSLQRMVGGLEPSTVLGALLHSLTEALSLVATARSDEIAVPPGVVERLVDARLLPTELTAEDKADPLGGAAVYLGEIAQQASYLRHTVATVDLPHVQAIQRAVDHADELMAAVRSMAAAAEVVPATPTAVAINEGLDRVLERVRTLALKDVERLNPRKLREAIDSLVWLEGQPGPLKPSLDEEPF
jgi:hypothetical protein